MSIYSFRREYTRDEAIAKWTLVWSRHATSNGKLEKEPARDATTLRKTVMPLADELPSGWTDAAGSDNHARVDELLGSYRTKLLASIGVEIRQGRHADF